VTTKRDTHAGPRAKEPRCPRERRIGTALDSHIGTWSVEQADAVLDFIAPCRQVDTASPAADFE
jgi:hypothetical protein